MSIYDKSNEITDIRQLSSIIYFTAIAINILKSFLNTNITENRGENEFKYLLVYKNLRF